MYISFRFDRTQRRKSRDCGVVDERRGQKRSSLSPQVLCSYEFDQTGDLLATHLHTPQILFLVLPQLKHDSLLNATFALLHLVGYLKI